MAIEMDFTDWGNTWTDAYWYIHDIVNVNREAKELQMVVHCYPDSSKATRPLIQVVYKFVGVNSPSPAPQFPLYDDWFDPIVLMEEGKNVLVQGYTYLLSLPEYSTGTPV